MLVFPAAPLRVALTLLALAAAAPARAADVQDSQDHPLVGKRYEGSEITHYQETEFDEYGLMVAPAENYGGAAKNEASMRVVEGRVTRIRYLAPAEQSVAAVFRSYATALKAAGFEEVFTCKYKACGGRNFNHSMNVSHLTESKDFRYLAARLPRPEDGDAYVSLYVGLSDTGGGKTFKRVITQLDVIEAEALGEKMVAVDAGEMAKAIDATGRIALYGIYFDTDKTEIKPESEETLAQIAKLLQDQVGLKLVVVGHTDNRGQLDYNMELSKRRAEAVKQALVADYGIEAGRLAAWGVGYLAPVASNRAEDGRAKNRRVELVEQ
ncbi:MAG: DUF4892 domain-containing protein [Kiloniellales bacterium]|nr:DUF4892 domain-containing protein [Kiloniellales bacterium]